MSYLRFRYFRSCHGARFLFHRCASLMRKARTHVHSCSCSYVRLHHTLLITASAVLILIAYLLSNCHFFLHHSSTHPSHMSSYVSFHIHCSLQPGQIHTRISVSPFSSLLGRYELIQYYVPAFCPLNNARYIIPVPVVCIIEQLGISGTGYIIRIHTFCTSAEVSYILSQP